MRGVVTEWKKYDRDLHLQHCFVKFVHLNAMSAPCSVGKLLSKENLQQLISDKDSSVTLLKHNENDRSSKVWSFSVRFVLIISNKISLYVNHASHLLYINILQALVACRNT